MSHVSAGIFFFSPSVYISLWRFSDGNMLKHAGFQFYVQSGHHPNGMCGGGYEESDKTISMLNLPRSA